MTQFCMDDNSVLPDARLRSDAEGEGRGSAETVAQGCAITLQFMVTGPDIPDEHDIAQWAGAALQDHPGEVTIRVTGETEMRALNHRWRDADRPTNVLSFPLHDAGCPLLGDIVICAPVLEREAAQQGKSLQAHWAHITIHGILHLMGYDHTDAQRAEIMETKETAILRGLGFPDPY